MNSKVIGFWSGLIIVALCIVLPPPPGMNPLALQGLGVSLLMAKFDCGLTLFVSFCSLFLCIFMFYQFCPYEKFNS
jgi:hypothetical protein